MNFNLELALQNAFDGNLTPSEAASLREILKKHPEALEAYCDQALLEMALKEHAAAESRILGKTPSSILFSERLRHRREIVISLLSAAATLLFGAIFLHFFSSEVKNSAHVEISPESILKHADGRHFYGSELELNQEIELVQGVSRLVLESGVTAVIDGPAALRLTGKNELQLSAGHAWFQVPKEAHGFRVTCSNFEVIDLGTEFGIDQREDQQPKVQVLKGKVQIRALSGARQSLELTAGKSAVLEPDGTWTPTFLAKEKFRKNLPARLPILKMDFEGLEGNSLVIEGDALGIDSASARLINPEHAEFVPGISGKALLLKGTGASIESDWSGISGSAPRTIALWCRVPADAKIETAPALVWWGNSERGSNKKFKFALVRNAAGHTVLRASFGEKTFNGSTNLADGQWHHLALVYRGNLNNTTPDLSFYIDGKVDDEITLPAPPVLIDTDIRSDDSYQLGIGKYELPAQKRNPFLHASIDQLRIFAGALDETAIRALATK